MKASRLFVWLFAISVCANSVFAGQTKEPGGQGVEAEPECDYMPVAPCCST
jgi:hypothetical protein